MSSLPTVLHEHDATTALVRGSQLMTRALCSTLGPHGGAVVSSPLRGSGGPELISRAGIVARRLIELEDPFENMGALLVRHAACRVERETGDGVATTAAILHVLLSTVGRGGPEAARGLAEAADAIVREVRNGRLDVDEQAAARVVAAELLTEHELAGAVCDAVEAVGEEGFVDVRPSRRAEVGLDLVEGTRWGAALEVSSPDAPRSLAGLRDARVLVCSDPLDDAAGLLTLVQTLMAGGVARLLVIAPAVSPQVRFFLTANAGRNAFPAVMVASLQVGADSAELAEDLAAYCGTRVVSRAAGDTLARRSCADLGAVRRAWLADAELTVVAAAPDGARERHRFLEAQLRQCSDDSVATALRVRLARLSGRTAVLAVPGVTGAEREERITRVRAAVRVAQSVLREGVTAGGGAALVQAAHRVEQKGGLAHPAGQAMLRAVAEPLRRVAARAGLDAGVIVERTRCAPPGTRLDVQRGRWLSAAEISCLLDSVATLTCALGVAASAASTTLTTAALVRTAHPAMSLEP